jgi:hypothetical protein
MPDFGGGAKNLDLALTLKTKHWIVHKLPRLSTQAIEYTTQLHLLLHGSYVAFYLFFDSLQQRIKNS